MKKSLIMNSYNSNLIHKCKLIKRPNFLERILKKKILSILIQKFIFLLKFQLDHLNLEVKISKKLLVTNY